MPFEVDGDVRDQRELQPAAGHAVALEVELELGVVELDRLQRFGDQNLAAQIRLPGNGRLRGGHAEMQIEIEGLAGIDRAGGERQLADIVTRPGGAVIPQHPGIGHLNAADGQARERATGRLVRMICTGFCFFTGLAQQIIPVAAAARILAEIQTQAGQPDGVHLQLLVEQRKQFDAHLYLLHAGHGLLAEALRIAQARRTDLQTQPRKHGKADIAVDTQGAAGILLHCGGDLVLEIIRVDDKRQHDRQHEDQSGGERQQAKNDFQEFSHRCCP